MGCQYLGCTGDRHEEFLKDRLSQAISSQDGDATKDQTGFPIMQSRQVSRPTEQENHTADDAAYQNCYLFNEEQKLLQIQKEEKLLQALDSERFKVRFLRGDDYPGYLALKQISPNIISDLHSDRRRDSVILAKESFDQDYPLEFCPGDQLDFEKQIEVFDQEFFDSARLMVLERYNEIAAFTLIQFKKEWVDYEEPEFDRKVCFIGDILIRDQKNQREREMVQKKLIEGVEVVLKENKCTDCQIDVAGVDEIVVMKLDYWHCVNNKFGDYYNQTFVENCGQSSRVYIPRKE